MELVAIGLLAILLVLLVLPLIATSGRARRDAKRQQETVRQMQQIKDEGTQQIRELNRAYRTQVAQLARQHHSPPRRRA